MPALEDAAVTKLKPNPNNNKSMFQIFQNVQFNVVQHKKYVKEMTKLYRQLSEDDFRESFKNALHYLFTFGDTSANVDRVVQFVATFCTSLDDEEEFLLFIFDIIFSCQCVSGQSVRYRASQLLAAVLSALGDDASLDDDLCEKLLASQMQRLQDTRGAVRCRAALALQRLQNPMETDDEVTRAYRFHMSCDPSSSVRRAVVMSIAKCSRNVPFVLERLCDVDEAVRRAAFLYIGAINVTQLRVRQRLLTLKVGLTERSHRVRRVVEEILIPGWLSAFKGNIIDLLKAIRLDNVNDAKDSEMVAGKLLESLFKRLPISELLEWLPTDKTLRLIPAEKLNKETAWYWRHLALHLQKVDDDETLETVLPDLVVLIGYIKAIVESPCPSESSEPVAFSIRQSVLHELGMLLQAYDAGDQAGRTALQELVSNVLTGDHGYLSPQVISSFVDALTLVMPQQSLRLEAISGIISQLREPEIEPVQEIIVPVESGEVKLKRARLRVSLNVAMEAQEEAVREQNYALAEECKAKVKDIQKKLDAMNTKPPTPPPVPVQPTIREKICDADTLNKCLLILNSALNSPDITTVTPMMQMIFNDLEVEIFQNPDILENALETVALYGMLNKEFAKENKAFFFANVMNYESSKQHLHSISHVTDGSSIQNLIDTSNERVVCVVLRCLVDLLCVHGARLFEEDESKDVSNQSLKKKRHTMDIVDEDGTLSESVLSMTPNHSTVIELLLKIMDSTCSTYRLIIVEGLCKLFTLGHLESATILSRLLLLWFNPATVDEDMLRQIIGVFFQSFASNVEGAQEQIQKATIPTLRALANAPSSSPISEIDQEAVVRFIVSLTRVHHESLDSEGSLSLILCNYMSSRPSCECVPLACRLLSLLHAPRDKGLNSQLAKSIPHILEKLQDKQSSRNLTRYLGVLEAASRTSINKLSTIDGTMQSEDNTMGKISRITTSLQGTTLHSEDNTLAKIGRMTSSLPHPIARSTHMVINETVEEEVEIDETSPTELISRISEECEPSAKLSDIVPTPKQSIESKSSEGNDSRKNSTESNSDRDVSPPKKAKVVKGKKKLSITKKGAKEKQDKEKKSPGGLKRSRSQRSVVDIDRAQEKKQQSENAKSQPKIPPADLDSSNVTVRRSVKPVQSSSSAESVDSQNSKKGKKKSGNKETAPKRVTRQSSGQMSSPRSSRGSTASLFENSADETELHTIVYEQELVQSLLDDSVEGVTSNMDNVTIAQTPESSEIESEPEMTNGKNKKNVKGKKK